MLIHSFEKFDKEAIKSTILKELKDNPNDVIEHCKDYDKKSIKKYYGYEILNLYQNNPYNNEPSLLIFKGNNTYYKALTN